MNPAELTATQLIDALYRFFTGNQDRLDTQVRTVVEVLTGASEPERNANERPPYQRLLQGDEARKAAELEKLVAERAEADDYAAALKAGADLLALRRRVQGEDHHEAVSARWDLE